LRYSLDVGALAPERAHDTDAGADLRSPIYFTIPAHGNCIINTGVHIELPPNTVGMLKSKSGLNVKHDIVSEGVLDEGYTGSIVVKLYNLGDRDYKVNKGDKITQLVVLPVKYVDFELVESVDGGERGEEGFGSTGK